MRGPSSKRLLGRGGAGDTLAHTLVGLLLLRDGLLLQFELERRVLLASGPGVSCG
jgi:hypothetical protein